MSPIPSVTFVACVESGALELHTVRMIESLRKWGGAFAACPVLVVTPRFGMPVYSATHEKFEELGVRYLRLPSTGSYSWFKFLNKPFALLAAESLCATRSIGWLDSDLLVLGEPAELELSLGEDFAACVPDKNVGTSGAYDPNEPYWQEVCRTIGVDIDALPTVVTEFEGIGIRLYFNSGVFVYSKSTRLAQSYLEDCLRVLLARISSRFSGIFFTDQVILGLTVHRMGLRYRLLPVSHNLAMGSRVISPYREEALQNAKILHHHDAMWPGFWPVLMERLRRTHRPVHDWLARLGPLYNPSPLRYRLPGKLLASWRKHLEERYSTRCTVY